MYMQSTQKTFNSKALIPSQQSDANFLQPKVIGLLLFLLALAWFLPLGYRHLVPTDEGRYAEIAREMWVSGDWITIRYNDYKYFEKPPLQMWATALTYQLFGLGEWQARFWVALTGFLSVIAVGFTGWRIFGARAGFLAAVVLASSPSWALGSHFNSLDMGLSGMMAFALCTLLLAQQPSNTIREQRRWMWCCWAAMALAVLSKGLVGIVLPSMVLVVYSLLARDWRLWSHLHIASGLCVFLLIAAPWFVLVSIKNPEFPHFFFIHEHFERFTTDEHNRTGSVFYFLPLLMIGFFPWLPQLFNMPKQAQQQPNKNGFNPSLLLLVWAVSIFIFFSASHSKLPGYTIPIFPALALLAGAALSHASSYWRWQLILSGGVLGVCFISMLFIFTFKPLENLVQYDNYTVWLIVSVGVGVLGTALAFCLRRCYLASVTCYAGAFLALVMLSSSGHETLGRISSGVDLAAKVRPLLQPEARLYALMLDHTLPFYLEHKIIMVQKKDELAFGIQQEPHKWVPTLSDFTARWNSEPQAFAIMNPTVYAQLLAQGLSMQKIAEDERRVVVKKP